MELRRELTPISLGSDERARVKALFETIEDKNGKNEDVTEELEKIRTITGRSYDADFYATYEAWGSFEEAFGKLCTLRPMRISGITKEELVEIVARAIPTNPSYDEKFAEYYMELFDLNVAMPGASDLIYYPPDWRNGDSTEWDPSPEEIVELALSYKPICL